MNRSCSRLSPNHSPGPSSTIASASGSQYAPRRSQRGSARATRLVPSALATQYSRKASQARGCSQLRIASYIACSGLGKSAGGLADGCQTGEGQALAILQNRRAVCSAS